jgi:hypothetical protein
MATTRAQMVVEFMPRGRSATARTCPVVTAAWGQRYGSRVRALQILGKLRSNSSATPRTARLSSIGALLRRRSFRFIQRRIPSLAEIALGDQDFAGVRDIEVLDVASGQSVTFDADPERWARNLPHAVRSGDLVCEALTTPQ